MRATQDIEHCLSDLTAYALARASVDCGGGIGRRLYTREIYRFYGLFATWTD